VAGDVAATTAENTPVVIDVLANDHDPDGDPLTVVGLTQPANGSAALNPDQTVTYTPTAGFIGADGFTYTVADPHGATDSATVTVTVEAANRAPVAGDVAATTAENTPVVIDVLANDHDPDGDPLTVVGLTQPANGSAALNPDQTVTYTPTAGFIGTDDFTHTIADPHGATDSATVTVTVLAAMGEPWADATLWDDGTGWVA
jgi:hypothetical protein